MIQETRVWSLGQEDPLEEGTATHSSTLVWRVPWTEEPGGLQSIGSQTVRHDWRDLAQHSKKIYEAGKNRVYNIITNNKLFTYVCEYILLVLFSSFSHVWLFATLWTITHQSPLSMGFSGQEYWSGSPFLPPGDLPNPASLEIAGKFFTIEPPGKSVSIYT